MTTASEWVRLAQSAALIDDAIALDGVWTRQLAAPIGDQDRQALIELGDHLATRVRDIAGSLGPVEVWAREDPEALGAAVDEGLGVAVDTLHMDAAFRLQREVDRAEWAGLVLAAIEVVRTGADAESDVLRRKVERIRDGYHEAGDYGHRVLVALHVIKAAIEIALPVAVLVGVVVAPPVAAVMTIAIAASELVVALTTPSAPAPPAAPMSVQEVVDLRATFDRRERAMRAWLVAHHGLTKDQARQQVRDWRNAAELGAAVFDDNYTALGLNWIAARNGWAPPHRM